MATNVKEMMAAANAAIPRLQPDEVRKMMGAADVLIVDVRDPPEVQASGKIKGAVAVCGHRDACAKELALVT